MQLRGMGTTEGTRNMSYSMITTGTPRLLMLALLASGCSTAKDPADGETDTGTQDSDSAETSADDPLADADMDGVPDATDDFIDLDGNGVDDREEGPVVDVNGDGHPDCVPGLVVTTQVPRLKNAEYDRTIRDLVGVTGLTASNNVLPSSLLATDQEGSLSDLGWSSYQTVGQMIATQVMADPDARAKFLLCDLSAPSCLDDTIVEFGRRAFRRPVDPEHVALFKA